MQQLITDCLHELATNEEARKRFMSLIDFLEVDHKTVLDYTSFNAMPRHKRIRSVEFMFKSFHSRPLIKFLDIMIETDSSSYPIPLYLYLRSEFINALYNESKTLEESLEIINDIYLQYV